MMKFVSWDYCSQLNGKIKHVPHHQPVEYIRVTVLHRQMTLGKKNVLLGRTEKKNTGNDEGSQVSGRLRAVNRCVGKMPIRSTEKQDVA